MPLTKLQSEHLAKLQSAFITQIAEKYTAGVEEHGGNLWEHDPIWLIEQALKENVDQFTYLMTAWEHLVKERGHHPIRLDKVAHYYHISNGISDPNCPFCAESKFKSDIKCNCKDRRAVPDGQKTLSWYCDTHGPQTRTCTCANVPLTTCPLHGYQGPFPE